MSTIIDAHRHLFEGSEDLNKLLFDMDSNEIDQTILMPMPSEMGFLEGVMGGNKYIFSAIKPYGDRLKSAIYIDPREQKSFSDLERYTDMGAVAVKMWHPIGYFPGKKEYYRVYEKIAELKLPIMIHTGYTNVSIETGHRSASDTKYAMPIELDELIHAFPEIVFIFAHGGDPDFAMAMLQSYANNNVYLNICGMADETGWDARIFRFYEIMKGGCAPLRFDRLIWGSDNLGIDLQRYKEIFKDLEQIDLFSAFIGETAKSVYQL